MCSVYSLGIAKRTQTHLLIIFRCYRMDFVWCMNNKHCLHIYNMPCILTSSRHILLPVHTGSCVWLNTKAFHGFAQGGTIYAHCHRLLLKQKQSWNTLLTPDQTTTVYFEKSCCVVNQTLIGGWSPRRRQMSAVAWRDVCMQSCRIDMRAGTTFPMPSLLMTPSVAPY